MRKATLIIASVVAATIASSNDTRAGCDRQVADADLQIAAPLTEKKIRALIAQAKSDSRTAGGPVETANR